MVSLWLVFGYCLMLLDVVVGLAVLCLIHERHVRWLLYGVGFKPDTVPFIKKINLFFLVLFRV